MFNLGMGEITVILLLILLFVGPKKLPDLASGLGRAIRQIRKTTADVKNEIVLDDTFRKPFEELREAVMLAPEELKRRDDLKEAVRRQAEEFERTQREAAAAIAKEAEAPATVTDLVPPEVSAPWGAPPPPLASAAPTATAPDRGPGPAGLAPGRHLPALAHAGAAAARPPGRGPAGHAAHLEPRWQELQHDPDADRGGSAPAQEGRRSSAVAPSIAGRPAGPRHQERLSYCPPLPIRAQARIRPPITSIQTRSPSTAHG